MTKEKVLKFVGEVLVIYGVILFVLIAYYDGKVFGQEISIVNYGLRMVLGFLPALVFVIPGWLLIVSVIEQVDNLNWVDMCALTLNFTDVGTYFYCILASVSLHLGIAALLIFWFVLKIIFSIFSSVFSILGKILR